MQMRSYLLKKRYNLILLPASECTKIDIKKRTPITSTFMKLDSHELFDTWKAQLLVRINKAFSPKVINFIN